MSRREMLARADLVFVGVVENQNFVSWPIFRFTVPGEKAGNVKYWRVLRRRVRIELVLRGHESRKVIDVYEISWTGGANGDWNFVRDGESDLFLVRSDNGHYHVVRDQWRSIFPVISGPHSRLPFDDSHPFWERFALMNWWIESDSKNAKIAYPYFLHDDPGGALSEWRKVKLERGLVRHPSPGVRIPACRALLELGGWGQDECWDALSDADRAHLTDGGYVCCTAADIQAERSKLQTRDAEWWWTRYEDREIRRLLTSVNNRRLRIDICRRYEREYPGDSDTGCPADRPPPATIVTVNGDVPLIGPWPQ